MFDKFEYKLVKFSGTYSVESLTNKFNELGQDGWEYVYTNDGVSIFKRKLKNIINS